MTTKPVIPSQWPLEMHELYEPVRELGRGGFASVMLAKRSAPPPPEAAAPEIPPAPPMQPSSYVAIKIVANPVRATATAAAIAKQHKKDLAYGFREIDILQAISHPSIMKCLEFFPHKNGSLAMVLSYSKGPTMEALLRRGGAFSSIFGQVVMAQIVDALSYLHDHAVVHRDIKPDNIIISGALYSQDEVWDNPSSFFGDDNEIGVGIGDDGEPVAADLAALTRKWKVTLVDFGFARALSPEDVKAPSKAVRQENLDASYQHHRKSKGLHKDHDKIDRKLAKLNSLDHSNNSRRSISHSVHSIMDSLRGVLDRSSSRLSIDGSRGRGRGGLDKSFSRMFHRRMSALGNRLYAAPEIVNHVQNRNQHPSIKAFEDDSSNIMATISDFVAEYGLLVDAYSLGCTFRYMMTGVPPHKSVSETLARQRSIRKRFGRWLSKKLGRSADQDKKIQKRTKRYRALDELPGEVQRLIRGLTEREEGKRTSVRSARRYPWIQAVLEDLNSSQSRTNNDPHAIEYLDLHKTKHFSAPASSASSPIPPEEQ